MNLSSFYFPCFLAAVVVLLCVLQGMRSRFPWAVRIQLVTLLIASYLFVLLADWRFSLCLAGMTGFVYGTAILLDNSKSHKAFFLTGGVVCITCFLGYYKYCNFFLNSFQALFHRPSSTLTIILPLGISFYTFSALAYLIDVYRMEYPAERNFLNLALYISFFPKLLAGPIVRGKFFSPQINDYRGIKLNALLEGVQIFVFGLFKKIVLADHLGVFVDDVFGAPSAFSSGTIWLAVISYSLQIYFDFSGYSDMAIGTAKMLGFDFKPNFNLPYLSRDFSEFWSRWHISLSSWFRDYLYIPLGGSRKGSFRTYFNLMLVMLVSGLWHGAGYTFIIWGALHGVASCVNKALGGVLPRLGAIVNIAVTFALVSLFWVVFRAENLVTACKVYKRMFVFQNGIQQPYTWSFFAILCLAGGMLVAHCYSRKKKLKDRHGNHITTGFYPTLDLTRFWPQVAFFSFTGLTILLGYYGDTAFIYGAF